MEKEYQKIGNVFKFDEKFRTVVGLNEPYETLKNIIWQGLVLVPRDVQLYDNKHKLIKCKCKYRDMVKAGLTKEKL